jgi:signal transduction histidine kinase
MSTILVIEDDQTARFVVRELLSRHGHRMIEATNGTDGIRLATEHRPDLIICDVAMPDLDGFAVLQKLRDHPATEFIPLIFLTALTERESVRLGMNLGAQDYITKPFAAEELLRSVAARLDNRNTIQARIQMAINGVRTSLTDALPHELRTPLSAILAVASILEKDADSISRPQLCELSRLIRESAERQHRLITRSLTFAELEAATLNPDAAPTFANHLTPSAIIPILHAAQSAAQSARRSQDLLTDLNDSPIAVEERWLTLLTAELCDNAFKFSRPHQPVQITSRVLNHKFELAIHNAGPPMSPAQLAAAISCSPCASTAPVPKGLGLGLPICHRIAELHGGHLHIASDSHNGTRVVARLPIAPTPPPAPLTP